MATRMKTGVPGLDTVLDGGFLYHNCVLLRGQPGTGKTTLGIQMIYGGAAQFGEPGIIVLFEQFPQQLFRDLASYQWAVEKLVEEKKLAVVFAQPEDAVSKATMMDSPLISQICTLADELGAKRILVDGFSHALGMVRSDRSERELFIKFINAIKSLGLTPIITAEGREAADGASFEEYLADCVVHLSMQATKDPTFQVRWLEVRKTRGQSHVRGRHPYRIGERGIEVFPFLPPASLEARAPQDMALGKVSSGISGLDEILRGGYTKGASVAIAGMPGTFKTTLAVQFLTKGAQAGTPKAGTPKAGTPKAGTPKAGTSGLLIGFNESPEFLMKTMNGKGLDLGKGVTDGRVTMWHYSPKSYYPEELLARLEQELARGGAANVAIDGVNEIERSIEDPARYVDFVTAFVSLLSRHGATSLFIQNLDQFTANAPLTNVRYADVFDGIIYTGAIEIESAVHKVISVLKMRGGDYLSDLREIVCGGDGLYVLDRFVGLSGILAGNAQGQYKKTVEEIFQPLYFVRDFMQILGSPDVTEAQRKQITENLISQVNELDKKLRAHFDIKEQR